MPNNGINPKTTYSIVIAAIDWDSAITSWSNEHVTTVPLGDFGMLAQTPVITTTAGQEVVSVTLVLTQTADLFADLAEKDNPPGILAVVHQPELHLDQLNPRQHPWLVALVAPQDPGNIGTILRTVDAVGASGLLLLDHSADPYHPSAIRASMGTIVWHPLVSATFGEFATWAAREGYTIYGTSAHAARDYRQVEHYRTPRILLMGSERQGLTAEQSAICHALLSLPMKGHATSLNLAVATGVILYSMLQDGNVKTIDH